MKRDKTLRDLHRAAIAATRPRCHICGLAINWAAKYPAPDCFVVDHLVPLNRGGLDVLENCRAAHNSCNRAKWDKPHAVNIIRRSGALA